MGVTWGASGELWRSLWVAERMTGDVNMSPVMFWGSLGGLWVGVGMPWDHGESLGASWDGLGRPLGCFWRYGAILGSVLRRQNIVISLVLNGFLRCHVLDDFS